MNRKRRWGAALWLVAVLLLSACAEPPSEEHVIDEPVTLERIDGTDLSRVILPARAAERLGIDTAPVERAGKRLVVPSAAVLVSPNGVFWVYTNPKPLVFVRDEIAIDFEDGDQAFLSDGPPPGTRVVTVGVPELYGAEFGIGH
jgi:hypothetical protein